MTSGQKAPASALDDLGGRVKALRLERNLTLSELSQRSRVSVAMLSHIERGQSTPSLQTLERLRIALEVPLASFFTPEQEDPKTSGSALVVVRADARAHLQLKELGLVKELLSPSGVSNLEVLELVIEPGGGSGPEPWTREGEKAGLVLEGRFDLTVAGVGYQLNEGDSFQFDSRKPHSFRNTGGKTSRVVWIIAPHAFG